MTASSPERRDALGILVERAFSLRHAALRQVPFTVVFFIVLAFGVLPEGDVRNTSATVIATVLTVVNQVLAVALPWRKLPFIVQMVLPVTQLVALLLLEVGTGRLVTVPLFLVIVGFAIFPGFWALALSLVATIVSVVLVFEVSSPRVPGTSVAVVMSTALFVVIGVHGVTGRLRSQRETVGALQRRQEATIEELRESRDANARSAERWRESGKLWRGLIDAATGNAIIATDGDGRIEQFNPGAERLLGYPAETAIGMDISQMYDEKELTGELDQRRLPHGSDGRRIVLTGDVALTGTAVGQWTFRCRDGELRPVQVTVSRRPDLDNGVLGGYLFVATDLTQQREAERLQDEFVGLVSHELRTPLTSVVGYLDLLRSDPDGLTEEQEGYVDSIDRNSKRLLRLVEDLLLSVQVSAGRFSLVMEDIDVAQVARQAVDTVRPAAGAAGVELSLDTDDVIPLRADPVRVGQLIDNLLTNAVKFTLRGGNVTVAVHSGSDDQGRSTVTIAVRDTGIGIAPDELERLTEQFYRARSARSRRIRGIGLGLSIVQAIVDAHHGHLSVTSELGKGTTFTVVIPSAA